MNLRKAVIPAAGFGTRMLPAAKAIPKELLPVLDRPTIQYVVEEAAAGGVDDVLLVTGRDKRAIEDHFDRYAELEDRLKAGGKEALLASVTELAAKVKVHAVRQPRQRGLGDAVNQARRHVGDEPFLCLLGDTIFSTPAAAAPEDVRDIPPMDQLRNRPLGRVLTKMGRVTREQVVEALGVQKRRGGPIGQILVDLGYTTRAAVDAALAAQRGQTPTISTGAAGRADAPLPARQLIDAAREFGTAVIGLEEVPADRVERYGIVGGTVVRDGVLKLDTLVEKPSRDAAPSRYAVAARYMLTPTIFECLDRTTPGMGGEIQLTDALRMMLAREPIHGVVLSARRHDIGNPVDWLKTNIAFAARDAALWSQLAPLLSSLMRERGGA